MTQEELATLKAEIKAEVIREMWPMRGPKAERPWSKVKEYAIGRLGKYDTYNQYSIINALSTIVRYSLGLNTTNALFPSQVEQAKSIVSQVLDIIDGCAEVRQ